MAAETLLDEQGPDIFFKELSTIILRDEREDGDQERECTQAEHE